MASSGWLSIRTCCKHKSTGHGQPASSTTLNAVTNSSPRFTRSHAQADEQILNRSLLKPSRRLLDKHAISPINS